MSQLFTQKIKGWRAVMRTASLKQKGTLDPYAFAKLVIKLASKTKLSEEDVIQLALHLGLKVFPRDRTYQSFLTSSKRVITGLPNDWVPFLNESFFSLAYRNPNDFHETISVVPSSSGFLPYIVHHTDDGYVNADWFNKIVPLLYSLSKDSKAKRKLNTFFSNQDLSLGQVNTINHFFKQDPILRIEGICTKCYSVSLPDKGFGVKYFYKEKINEVPSGGIIKEIRYSARKTNSK